MEAELVPKHGIEIDFIQVKGLRGQGLMRLLKAPFQIVNAILQARRHLLTYQPDAVLGMGGYVSGPAGLPLGYWGFQWCCMSKMRLLG